MSAGATNHKQHPPGAHGAYYAGYEDSRLGVSDGLAMLREHGRPEDLDALLATYREAYAEQSFGWQAIAHMRDGAAGHGAAGPEAG
jgi:hypothetical protein